MESNARRPCLEVGGIGDELFDLVDRVTEMLAHGMRAWPRRYGGRSIV